MSNPLYKIRRLALVFSLIAGLSVLLYSPPSLAVDYGEGDYGACPYQQGCPAPTTITTPSGLQISVNLSDGQIIPAEGYEIIVTPLNGQGESFTLVEFYIDGQLRHSMAPDQTGTARWFWDVQRYPGSVVKVVAYDASGQRASEEFNVSIEAEPVSPGAGAPTKPGQPGQGSPSGPLEDFIAALPPVVVYGFPYLLFLWLMINLLLLYLQARDEIKEYKLAKRLLAQLKAINEAKTTLVVLASHYLRTPMTVIMGGVDMLAASADAAVVKDLRKLSEGMRLRVESIIEQVRGSDTPVTGMVPPGTQRPDLRFWQRPGLFLPIILAGGLILSFDILVNRYSSLALSQASFLVQALIYSALVLVTYLTFRHIQLSRRNNRQLREVIAAETELGRARDTLIADVTGMFGQDLVSMEKLVKDSGGQPKATGFINDGIGRFGHLLNRFAVAKQLQGAQSQAPFLTTTLAGLIGPVSQVIDQKAQKEGVRLTIDPALSFAVQDAPLITVVLNSLLDNAVGHSRSGGRVRARASSSAKTTLVKVSDWGEGIPPDKLTQIFQPFSLVEDLKHLTHEGLGFSLYLDKVIMTYLRGSIAVDSTPGEGTTVTLTLPKPGSA